MLFLEVSLLAFLLQGNNASGVEALTRTFGISGIIVGFDVLLKVILLFSLEISLSLCWLCMNSLPFSLLGYISICIWGPLVHRHRSWYSSLEVELMGYPQARAHRCLWAHIVHVSF